MADVERAREFATRARAQMREGDNCLAIATLARAFHALEHAAGLDPWDAEALYHWAIENLHTDAERHCARFILSVWNQVLLRPDRRRARRPARPLRCAPSRHRLGPRPPGRLRDLDRRPLVAVT